MKWGRIGLSGVALAVAASGAWWWHAEQQSSERPLAHIETAQFRLAHVDGMVLRVYPFGAVQESAIWRKPGWTPGGEKPIDVCWENLAESSHVFRDWVKDAVATTWARHGMVSFHGWRECTPADTGGIRIGVRMSMAETSALGQHLAGKRYGMLLRRDFSSDSDCVSRQETCIRATAVHEFGHALGLTHEQNRGDAPEWCRGRHQGTFPDRNVTDYDPQSIMNYCNKDWNNPGLLSQRDIATVGALYGTRM